jgi:hypothetical protein
MAQNEYAFLATGNKEYIKSYLVYDGSNRLEYVYEARANAQHGDYALVTQYEYDGVSNRVVKTLESSGTWDSTYDI